MLSISEQYADSLLKPNVEPWTFSRATAQLPKSANKNLISAKMKPYNIVNMNAKLRPNSTHDSQAPCFFNKEINKKVYNLF